MHDIIGDIIDWDQAHRIYLACKGQTGERFNQRLEAAEQMAGLEARWRHLPGGFHGEWKRIKIHIQAVAESPQVTSREELCWLAIAAASAWIPTSASSSLAGPTPVPTPDVRKRDGVGFAVPASRVRPGCKSKPT